MRLIDADEFKEQVIGAALKDGTCNVVEIANALVNLIDAQPTAYDADKLRRPEDMTADEVWKLAEKITEMPCNELAQIFPECEGMYVMRYFSQKEAKARIENWEAEKEIKVGDIVHSIDRPGIEVMITARHKDGYCDGINAGGSTHSGMNIKYWKKTGRHIDIQSVLKQIGGIE